MNAVPKLRGVLGATSGGGAGSRNVLGQRQADQAAAVLGHEVDDFGRDFFGGDGEVAFVLAIFVVDDHEHAAGANLLDGGRHIRECGLRCHYSAIVANGVWQESACAGKNLKTQRTLRTAAEVAEEHA